MKSLPIDDVSKQYIKRYHDELNEKERRRNAASLHLAFNCQYLTALCELLEISAKTIRKALSELDHENLPLVGRQRRKGAGAKSKWNDPEVNKIFHQLIEPYTAGDPMDSKIKWTNLSRHEIVNLLLREGVEISKKTAGKLLKNNGFKKRKIQKRKSLKKVADRDEQFNIIQQSKEEFALTGNPMLSVDTKKKEDIGDNIKEGSCYSTGQINGPDHTYSSLNTGKAIPHGIYDIQHNQAYLNIGRNHETAESVVDSLVLWWNHHGIRLYPKANKLLLLFDAGGANSYRHHIFKLELQRLANTIGMEIMIKHYPSYASKWNPIEHRVFPHIARVIKGVFIKSINQLMGLASRAKTKTGLTVDVCQMTNEYEIGKRATEEDVKRCNINFSETLPKWNYSVSPAF
jgi:hypothetical protein